MLAVTIAAGIVWLAGSKPLHAQTPTQTPTCSEASLKGKYSFAGSGDIYTWILNIFGIKIGVIDTTVDNVGYIVADGKGNIEAARLFESSNAGVSDTTYFGTYSITNCDTGTLKLMSWSQTLNLTLDLDNLLKQSAGQPSIAVTAQAEDTDPDRNEVFNLSRTLDPVGCGSTLNFDGMNTAGPQRGYSPDGQKLSAIISMDFAPGGIFSGVQKQSMSGQFTTSPVTGSYTVNSDCTVTASRTINGVTVTGASVILGNGINYLPNPWIWQGEECNPAADSTASPTGQSSAAYDTVNSC